MIQQRLVHFVNHPRTIKPFESKPIISHHQINHLVGGVFSYAWSWNFLYLVFNNPPPFSKLILNHSIFFTHNLSSFFGKQILSHLIQEIFIVSKPLNHKNLHYKLTSFWMTYFGALKKEKEYRGRLHKTKFIMIILPIIDIYLAFPHC